MPRTLFSVACLFLVRCEGFEQFSHDTAEDAHGGRKAEVASDFYSELSKLKVAMGKDIAALKLKLVAQEAREKITERQLEELERNTANEV